MLPLSSNCNQQYTRFKHDKVLLGALTATLARVSGLAPNSIKLIEGIEIIRRTNQLVLNLRFVENVFLATPSSNKVRNKLKKKIFLQTQYFS